MPSHKVEMQQLKKDMTEYIESTMPLFEKLEQRVNGTRQALEDVLWKLDQLENQSKELLKKYAFHEVLIADISTIVTQELMMKASPFCLDELD